ncbi:MAG: chlororespiratory reduction protein 7 [Crocosphaera sp.]
MPDSIMYQEDGFVVLEPDQPEQILTHEELLEKLKGILVNRQDDLPRELQKLTTVDDQAKYLMENFCDLDMGSDDYLQWYVIRLEK